MLEVQNEDLIHKSESSKYKAQLRALFLKSARLQSRQRCTNCCQLVLPVILVFIPSIIYHLISGDGFSSSTSYNGGDYFDPSYETQYCSNSPTQTCGRWEWYYVVNPNNQPVGSLLPNGNKTGFLSYIPQLPFEAYSSDGPVGTNVPYFQPAQTAEDVDTVIFNLGKELMSLDSSDGSNSYLNYQFPLGAVIFERVDPSRVSLDMTVQIINSPNTYCTLCQLYPSDIVAAYSGDGNLNRFSWLIGELHSALLNAFFSNTTNQYKFSVSALSYYYEAEYLTVKGSGAFFAVWFLPIAFTFLMPVYVFTIVMEKQEKLLEMMKIMGLSMGTYWAISYLFFYVMYVIVVIMVSIIGLGFKLPFFWDVPAYIWIILLFLWGHAQTSLGFLWSTLFSRQRVATIVSYFLVLATTFAAIALNLFVFQVDNAPGWYMWYPPFTFIRGVVLICQSFYDSRVDPLEGVPVDSEMARVYYVLVLQTVVAMLVAIYFDNVLPKEHGVRYSPLYPIYSLRECFLSRSKSGYNLQGADSTIQIAEEEVEGEDEDCAAERHRVSISDDTAFMLKIKDIHKAFSSAKGMKIALQKFCLGVETGECFGLLGPNGAGKSTLAHTLSGLIRPTSGYAVINGFNILNEMYKVHQILGFCPQHDILWPDLTVEEHLLFYIRLKGIIAHSDEVRHAHTVISRVGLSDMDRVKRVSQLSGGMKRRLSIAISLVGNPKLVLLDEPTTGLDPETRRAIWDIINEQKAGKSIILTTHNMEEADVLCTRIGIVSKGRLVCIGNQLHLKNKFGKGYHLSVTAQSGQEEAVNQYITGLFPNAVLESSFSGVLSFQISREDLQLGMLFQEMKAHRQQHGIVEWGINQTSLEEVFLKIIHEDESSE